MILSFAWQHCYCPLWTIAFVRTVIHAIRFSSFLIQGQNTCLLNWKDHWL
jgi:hypothetical protein